MSVSVTQVHETPLAPEPSSAGRARWSFLGALAAVGAIAYGAGALTRPSPIERPSTAIIGQQPEQARNIEPNAPEARGQAAKDTTIDNEESVIGTELSAESDSTQPTGAAFHVQVASYRNAQDALSYAANLSTRGLPAQALADPASSSWHLVRLGPYPSRAEAEKGRFALMTQEREKAHVLPRSNGKYHVQVGSFATREKAEPVAKRLEAAGHVTKISHVKMGDRRWYCVRIGPFDTAQEAADYQDLVKGGVPSTVIPYPPPKP